MRVFLWISLLVCAARDAALAPQRSPTAPGRRWGDYLVRIEGFKTPDSVYMGDTVRVPFSVADGGNPCSYSAAMVTTRAGVIYISLWGVRQFSAVCPPPAFVFKAPGPWLPPNNTEPMIYPSFVDPLVWRVVVCKPDGSFTRSEMHIQMPWRINVVTKPQDADSTAKVDLRECRWVASLPSLLR